jgi:hypothetical protein
MLLFNKLKFLIVLIAIAMAQPACEKDEEYPVFEVRSLSFGYGETIPSRHTCAGSGESPHLTFAGLPEEALTFVLILEDADYVMGTFTHWLIWNLDATLPIKGGTNETPPENARQGMNDANLIGYLTPCPQTDGNHRFYYRVFALDTALTLENGASRKQLERAMKKHIVGEGHIMGLVRP